ncbi:UNVERIFIED_CONTAM: UPF0755 protein [Acetivibrio alkalicellulosi]
MFLYLLFFLAVFIVSSIISHNYLSGVKVLSDAEITNKINPETAITIEIPFNSNTNAIAEILEKNGLIKYPVVFKYLSIINGHEGKYRSGQHLLSDNLTYDEIMRLLSQNPISTNVTIPEGKNFIETMDILAKNNLIDRESFIEEANNGEFNYKFLEDLPMRENRLEGYLFPDTYFFDPKSGPRTVIRRFLENFDMKFTPDFYVRAKELNMTIDEVITLASVIEKETRIPDEREIVSSVFHNRLKSNEESLKKLQSCATVQYILLNRDGKIKEVLSYEDTRIDHPYNTYLHEGLPPGPICSPSLESIIAALYPNEESDYYFFVAKGDGSHHFSRTSAEHEAAKEKYGVSY